MASLKEDLYIRLDEHVRTETNGVLLKDMASIYCSDPVMKSKAENILIFTFEKEDGRKEVISVLYVYKAIHDCLGTDILIHSIGAKDCLVELFKSKKKNYLREILKTIFVSLVTFCGAAFSIMTYDQDAGVADVFSTLYEMFRIPEPGNGVLELSYSIGIGLGVIVFFHHFEKKEQRTPTAMEIQMNKYEQDMVDSYVKAAERRGKSLEVDD